MVSVRTTVTMTRATPTIAPVDSAYLKTKKKKKRSHGGIREWDIGVTGEYPPTDALGVGVTQAPEQRIPTLDRR
jgi:hypothetical protein